MDFLLLNFNEKEKVYTYPKNLVTALKLFNLILRYKISSSTTHDYFIIIVLKMYKYYVPIGSICSTAQ